MLLGHATESRNWVSGWPKLVLMLDSARAVKACSGLGSMHISIRRQQSPQMVVMATEITVCDDSLHRSIDELVCLSNCQSDYLPACLPFWPLSVRLCLPRPLIGACVWSLEVFVCFAFSCKVVNSFNRKFFCAPRRCVLLFLAA